MARALQARSLDATEAAARLSARAPSELCKSLAASELRCSAASCSSLAGVRLDEHAWAAPRGRGAAAVAKNRSGYGLYEEAAGGLRSTSPPRCGAA